MENLSAVGGALLGLLALLVVVGAALLVVAMLRIEGRTASLLAMYVVGFGEIVGLALLLSLSNALERRWLLTGVLFLVLIAFASWRLWGGRPDLRLRRGDLEQLRRSPQCFLLGVAVGIGFAYVLALLLWTPPNGWDPLNYHLSRAAFWLQDKGIGYIEPTYDERLNLNPPNGEIGSTFALGVTHDEVFAGIVQFAAAFVCALAVFGLARRVGRSAREAAFGALLFLTLPIVALQASLSKNDLVVASFLLVAAFFILGARKRELALAGVATALAVGTKTTALYGVVVLLLLACVARPVAARTARLASVVAGAIVGAYWYAVNLAETRHFFGDQSAQQSVTAIFHLRSNVVTAFGTFVDLFDVSGAPGKDVLIYVIVGVVVAVVAFRRSRAPRTFVIALVAALPLLVLVLSEHVGRPLLVHLHNAVADPRGYIAVDTPQASPTIASDTASWFGPVGLVCILAAPLLAGARSRVGRLLTIAPLLWFVMLSLTLSYNPFLGRFFIFPVALSAALWGGLLRRPELASAITVLAIVTLGLSLVHYVEKPSGLRLLDRTPTHSVWHMTRAEVQSQHDPALEPVLQFVDGVPTHASIALALSDNGFGYPVFGPHLTRRVPLVPGGSSARDIDADWLYASRQRSAEIDRSCWQPQLESAEGTVFERRTNCTPG